MEGGHANVVGLEVDEHTQEALANQLLNSERNEAKRVALLMIVFHQMGYNDLNQWILNCVNENDADSLRAYERKISGKMTRSHEQRTISRAIRNVSVVGSHLRFD